MSLKKTMISFLAVCACVSGTSATSSTSTKIKDFEPAGAGLFLNPRADGMAMVRFNADIAGSDVHLRMDDLQCHTTYGVAIQATNSGSIDYSNPLAFTTNWGGDGSFEVSLPTLDLGTNPIFYVYIWDGNADPDAINDVTESELCVIGATGLTETHNVKIKDFDPAGPGLTANCGVDGMAVMNYNSVLGGSDVHLHLKDLQPNVTYGVALQATSSASPDYSNPQAFTTAANGAGSFDVLLPTLDLGNDPIIYIYVWDGNPDPDAVLDVSASEMRAIGAVEHHHHHGGCQSHGCCHH